MREKDIINIAKILSAVFSPFYLPVVGLIILYTFSYLKYMQWEVQLYIFVVIFTFTVMLPTALIRLYRRYHGWKITDIAARERRMVPYVITIICYLFCHYVNSANHIPYSVDVVVMASLFIQVTCAIINQWWKISTHSAAIGGVTGVLIAFAEIYSYNPVWWLCIVLLLAGMVGTSRIILRQHSLSQVVTGFLTGMLCAIITVFFI